MLGSRRCTAPTSWNLRINQGAGRKYCAALRRKAWDGSNYFAYCSTPGHLRPKPKWEIGATAAGAVSGFGPSVCEGTARSPEWKSNSYHCRRVFAADVGPGTGPPDLGL